MVWLVLLVLLGAIVVVDRILIWCELKGWIYYRLTPRPVRQSVGNALMSVEEFYRPSKRHAIELVQEEDVHREDDDEGAADRAAGPRPSRIGEPSDAPRRGHERP